MRLFLVFIILQSWAFSFAQINADKEAEKLFFESQNRPVAMAVGLRHKLYFAEYESNCVSVVDLEDGPPYSKSCVRKGLNGPAALHGDGLLFAAEYLGDSIDIWFPSTGGNKLPTYKKVYAHAPNGVISYGKEVFVASFLRGEIHRIGFTNDNRYDEVFLEGLSYPKGFGIFDGYLYYAENFKDKENADRIMRTSLEGGGEVEVVVEGLFRPNGMTVKDGYLYFNNIYEGILYRVDLEEDDELEPIVTNLDKPTGLAFDGPDLYVCENGSSDNILMIPDVVLQTTYDVNLAKKYTEETAPLILFPNPVFTTVEVKNPMEAGKFTIYDSLGIKVLKGSLSSGPKVDLSSLPSGVYFFSVEGRGVSKFVKKN